MDDSSSRRKEALTSFARIRMSLLLTGARIGTMNLPPHSALSPAAGERESCIQRWLIFRRLGLINARMTILAATTVFLVSCEKPAPDSPGNKGRETAASQPTTGATAPFDLVTQSGVEMVYLPGGEFIMGSSNADEAPPHKVQVSGFLIDKFEVTHELFTKVQLPNPSHWQDNPKKPVERVRWRDAKQYCNERSLLEGRKPCYNEKTMDWDCDYLANGYRLPTEAEWEYAAKAGIDGSYDFGQPDKLRQYAWFLANADQKTHAVGQKKANRWGLYDLYGNVSEWCEDVYSPAYHQDSPTVDPHGPANPGQDSKRVIRGGSWKSSQDACRTTARQGEKTGDSDACFSTDYCGFRCVRRVSAEGEPFKQ
jgi:formylglycine-generating enzyme required for sulfatase activity